MSFKTLETISTLKYPPCVSLFNNISINILNNQFIYVTNSNAILTSVSDNEATILVKNGYPINAQFLQVSCTMAIIAVSTALSLHFFNSDTELIYTCEYNTIIQQINTTFSPLFVTTFVVQQNHDNSRIFCGTNHGYVLIFRVSFSQDQTIQFIESFQLANSPILAMIWNPDKTLIIVSYDNGIMEFYNPKDNWQKLDQIKQEYPGNHLMFLDNDHLVVAKVNGCLDVYRLKDQTLICTINAHLYPINGIQLLKNKFITVAGDEVGIWSWRIEKEEFQILVCDNPCIRHSGLLFCGIALEKSKNVLIFTIAGVPLLYGLEVPEDTELLNSNSLSFK